MQGHIGEIALKDLKPSKLNSYSLTNLLKVTDLLFCY